MEPVGKALLLGNGINLAAGLRPSWTDIVRELLEVPASDPPQPRLELTPFPLLIEEAFGLSPTNGAEQRVQAALAARLHSWTPGTLHSHIVALPVRHILTTNFDLTIEAASQNGAVQSERPIQNEKRYSIFRRNLLPDGKRVWHIHGSIQAPETMVLGFEHYAGTLHAIRQCVVDERRYKRRRYGPVKKLIADLQNREAASWLEVALSHDLMILGSSMNFAELGLWWLFTYRARALRTAPGSLPTTRIIYAHRVDPQHKARGEALRSQLRACDIEVLDIDEDWPSFYESALTHFAALPNRRVAAHNPRLEQTGA